MTLSPRITLSLLAATLLLGACASKEVGRAGDAAVTPLKDLNVVREAIPEVLRAARKAPYRLDADTSCASTATEVAALDDALGPDLDAPRGAEAGLLERGTDAAGDAAIGAVRRTAEDVIPFRGWIRKLTGAERHSREVTAAVIAGGARRAFLKGWRSAQGCPGAEAAATNTAQRP
ncbi:MULTISPECIES: hypothetical protein [unclassified Rubrivivax]|uniref:hypothetical protein n=1 Tax=unclassified Rubrivivax TaxID=2649762 RepID=UPI0013E92486|nr:MULTISPECIES: hypothetical protein [unclassified Rubrivivax]MCC9595768.1 hypothetical protein [Rubrivivax sp. JA1055]MCC9647892.1 hypothetical protein [Rubrivivax sp. JA1029]MCD0418029.1 hypothetical protein [Rubrivivax sp. JA1024]